MRAVVAVLCIALMALPSPARGDDEASLTDQAGELTQDGQKAQEQGDYLRAIAKFRAAYKLAPHPVLLFNIGQAHRLAGNRHAARKAYRKYLAIGANPAALEKAKRFVAELTASIEADPSPDPNPEPEPEKPKPVVKERVVVVEKPVAPVVRERRMTALSWTVAGVSVASLAVGTTFLVMGYSDFTKCDDRGTCETDSEVDDIDTKLLVGDVLMGVSVAAAVTTGVLFWLSGGDEVPPATVTPVRGGATIGYTTRF